MAQTILLKRGIITNIDSAELEYGELALAYNADKTKVSLYTGDGNGGKILINDDVIVPTKVSELTNDSKYQTETEVSAAIASAIAAAGHASFEKVDNVPSASDAAENVLYLVMNSATSHYDIYAKVGNEVVLLDDTTVDLSGYATKTALDGKVDKVDGKGLSSNDYTTADKDKLAGVAANANNYTHPSSHEASMITQDNAHRFVTDDEKSAWNSKLSSTSTIDGGTF